MISKPQQTLVNRRPNPFIYPFCAIISLNPTSPFLEFEEKYRGVDSNQHKIIRYSQCTFLIYHNQNCDTIYNRVRLQMGIDISIVPFSKQMQLYWPNQTTKYVENWLRYKQIDFRTCQPSDRTDYYKLKFDQESRIISGYLVLAKYDFVMQFCNEDWLSLEASQEDPKTLLYLESIWKNTRSLERKPYSIKSWFLLQDQSQLYKQKQKQKIKQPRFPFTNLIRNQIFLKRWQHKRQIFQDSKSPPSQDNREEYFEKKSKQIYLNMLASQAINLQDQLHPDNISNTAILGCHQKKQILVILKLYNSTNELEIKLKQGMPRINTFIKLLKISHKQDSMVYFIYHSDEQRTIRRAIRDTLQKIKIDKKPICNHIQSIFKPTKENTRTQQ